DITQREALFGLIGDFNGDGQPDLILNGDIGDRGVLIIVVSKGFRPVPENPYHVEYAYHVERLALFDGLPSYLREFRTRPRTDDERTWGLELYLSLRSPGIYRSSFQHEGEEPEPLELNTYS